MGGVTQRRCFVLWGEIKRVGRHCSIKSEENLQKKASNIVNLHSLSQSFHHSRAGGTSQGVHDEDTRPEAEEEKKTNPVSKAAVPPAGEQAEVHHAYCLQRVCLEAKAEASEASASSARVPSSLQSSCRQNSQTAITNIFL